VSTVFRDQEGRPYWAQVRSAARVSIERLPDSGDAVVRFDDDAGSLYVVLALDVFPRLVDMIQFAGLSDTPRVGGVRRWLSPSEGVLPGLVVRKAPGDGDGA
jgi:hypothetical protein